MLRWSLCALGVFGAVGCSVESTADTSMKAGLVGTWEYELKDPSERTIKGVVTLNQDGTFKEKVAVAGEPVEESASGVWHLTGGMLKLDSTERDGKKMGTLDDRYRTCTVASLSAASFDCAFASGGHRLHFKKA